MHLFGFVAVNTDHVALDGVNVTLASFAQVFVANPTAVTGSALIDQVRTGLELVAINKSLAHRCRPADMTAAAAGVALAAMAFKAHVDGLVLVLVSTMHQDICKGTQRYVQ